MNKKVVINGKEYEYRISIAALETYTRLTEKAKTNMDGVVIACRLLHDSIKATQLDKPFWKRNVPSVRTIKGSMHYEELLNVISDEFGKYNVKGGKK